MAGNPDFFKQSHQKSAALGERAVQSDFELIIEGLEEFAPLVRTAQDVPVSRGEHVVDEGAYGQTYKQYGAVKRDGEMNATIVELKDGRVSKAIWKIINDGIYVKARLVRKGEDYKESGYVMEHVLLTKEQADHDTSGRQTILNIPLNLSWSWCEEI